MAGLKTIPIYTADIIKGTRWMKDNQGRLDLLGQILFTGYGIKIHTHVESPAHQGVILHPFTVRARNRIHNTELTIKLLQNADILSGRKQLEVANVLLEELDIYLERET